MREAGCACIPTAITMQDVTEHPTICTAQVSISQALCADKIAFQHFNFWLLTAKHIINFGRMKGSYVSSFVSNFVKSRDVKLEAWGPLAARLLTQHLRK